MKTKCYVCGTKRIVMVKKKGIFRGRFVFPPGIVFNNLKGEPFICECCYFHALTGVVVEYNDFYTEIMFHNFEEE